MNNNSFSERKLNIFSRLGFLLWDNNLSHLMSTPYFTPETECRLQLTESVDPQHDLSSRINTRCSLLSIAHYFHIWGKSASWLLRRVKTEKPPLASYEASPARPSSGVWGATWIRLANRQLCPRGRQNRGGGDVWREAVSYTHLTLPTIYSV